MVYLRDGRTVASTFNFFFCGFWSLSPGCMHHAVSQPAHTTPHHLNNASTLPGRPAILTDMAPKDEADDVLDFINSLPDSKSNTPKPAVGGDTAENKEDFLEFLDELAAHDKSTPTNKTSFEPKQAKKPVAKTDVSLKSGEELSERALSPHQQVEPEADIDPIGSISNWWSSEGSHKVSSLWGSITSNAQQISDQTYQLASSTSNQISQQRQKILSEGLFTADRVGQLDYLGERLNTVLSTMSQQITQGLIGPDDELLNVLLIHDLDNIPYLDKICSANFNRVMGQVEGGIRVTVNNFNHKQAVIGTSRVNLNIFYGKVIDGEKLCFANLESSVKDYSSYNLPQLAPTDDGKQDPESETEETQISKSNIFISVQAITSRSATDQQTQPQTKADGPILIESNNHDSFAFTIILKDISNNITIVTKTQPFPLIWAQWLSGEALIEDENVNPSEWVKDWVKDGLALSFGVLAQQYVIKRMGY